MYNWGYLKMYNWGSEKNLFVIKTKTETSYKKY